MCLALFIVDRVWRVVLKPSSLWYDAHTGHVRHLLAGVGGQSYALSATKLLHQLDAERFST